jgi:SAM-dependent methyltransferase
MTTPLFRPAPVDPQGAKPVERRHNPLGVARGLLEGRRGVVADHYSTGAEVLAQLDRLDPAPPQDAPFEERRAWQAAHREAALRLLAPVREHRLALGGGRPIGFLEELYPDRPDLHLPFLQLQELHGAWGRYREGVHLPVLGHALHPFFGTYIPRRAEHLEMFAQWLKAYDGPTGHAVDVGTGSGVLAFLAARGGFARITATDTNPNALESVRRDVARRDPRPPIRAVEADLFPDDLPPADLVVFNPPWLPGTPGEPFDAALEGPADLLERFFGRVVDVLAPGGRVVVLWSNIGQLVRPDLAHPLEEEVKRGRLRFDLRGGRRLKRGSGRGGKGKTRERVELWGFSKEA